MKTYKYFCALCHEEFDYESAHNSGSYFEGQRLDGICKGDFRLIGSALKKARVKPDKGPKLDLDAGEPIVFKQNQKEKP